MADDHLSMQERSDAAYAALVQKAGTYSYDLVTFTVAFQIGYQAAMRDAYATISRRHAVAHAKSMPILEALNAGNAAFLEALNEIESEAGIECIGSCETCSKPLFSGDHGYHETDAGMYFCAEHAPTYQDWKVTAETEPEAFEDEEQRLHGLQQIQAHIDDGGKLTDKLTYVLP